MTSPSAPSPPSLVSLAAELEALEPGTLPVTHGETMQTEFLQALHRWNPVLAKQLHDSPAGGGARGYTISPLYMLNGVARREDYWTFSRGARCWFRLTAYRPTAVEALWFNANHRHDWHLIAGKSGVHFQIRRWITPRTPQVHRDMSGGWINQSNPECLRAISALSAPGAIRLEFISPTAFRRGDSKWNSVVALPLPELVWGSLYRRWLQVFPAESATASPPPIWNNEWFNANVSLGRFEIRSEMMNFQKHNGNVPGFVGAAEFQFHRKLSNDERRFLWMLCQFGIYAGVGSMTSWGMGQMKSMEP